MLTARNVIGLAIGVAGLSLILACLSLLRAPDSGGMGGDTFGTRAHGQRALFEILTDLALPVERILAPPTAVLDRPVTLVFWKPQVNLVELEPAYLQKVAEWIQAGGRVVVAPDQRDNVLFPSAAAIQKLKQTGKSVLEELDLSKVRLRTIDLDGADDADEDDQKTAEKSKSRADERRLRDSDVPLEDQDLKHLRELLTGSAKTIATRFVAVKGTGEFAAWLPASATLAIPERDLSIIQPGGPEPTGAITFDDGGTERILAASYRVGEGEVVVMAAAVAENRQIARADNSVLMVRLLSSAGRPVVFDEFYHGLTLRGNPLWLFTRPGYAAATICLLALIGLWVWREAVFLGPPLEAAARSRRTLGEYVEAMARFLNQGASSRPFLLREVRDGALHAIRQELRLPPGREHVDELAAVLARRSPGRARDLIEAVADIDSALTAKHKCREQDAVRLMQRISHCL